MRTLLPLIVIACVGAGAANAAILKVGLNHSERLRIAGSASSVVVGNPAVADVTVVDSRTVFVSGKAYGSTNVAVMDALGRTLYAAELVVAAPGSQVTVFRGALRDEMACETRCEPVASTSAGATAGAAPAPSPLAALGQGLSSVPSMALTSASMGAPTP